MLLSTLLGQSVLGQDDPQPLDASSPVVVQKDLVDDGLEIEKAEFEKAESEKAGSAEMSESFEKDGARSLRKRLISYAFFGGLLLVFLALLFGYLRLDHATRGFHSGRLQIAALALCAVVLVVGYLLWTQVLFK